MEVKNKLEKFLTGLASVLFVVATMMGIKIVDDNKKIVKLENSLIDYNASMASTLENQKQIIAGRESILANLATALAPNTTKTVTTQTVVPGKVVATKVPVASSSSSSSKSSKSPSSSTASAPAPAATKTTKTS